MPDTKLPASGNIRIWFTPLNGFANPLSPTVAELTASLDISDAVSWNDFDFGMQASNTTSDPAITAKGAVTTRGAAQYGGSLSFYYPGVFNDNSNLYSLVFDALRLPGTGGWITIRVDGRELSQTASTTSNPGTLPAANDFVTVFRVETAGYAEAITGEEAFRYTISFLSKGVAQPYTIVRATAAAPTIAITPAAPGSGAVGTVVALSATVNTRPYTRGLLWTSSNTNVAVVSPNGIITRRAVGTANIIGTFVPTNTASTAVAITVA